MPRIPGTGLSTSETPSTVSAAPRNRQPSGARIWLTLCRTSAFVDALKTLGVEVTDSPITPRRLLAAIAAARGGGSSQGRAP